MGNCACVQTQPDAEALPEAFTLPLTDESLVKPQDVDDDESVVKPQDVDDDETSAGSDLATGAEGADKCPSPTWPSVDAADESYETVRPDFNGTWMCSRVEGDWDAFLRERGTPWAMRKFAKGMDYGVGKQMQMIIQNGDEIEIVNHTPSCPSREDKSVLKADGSLHDGFDPDGLLFKQRTHWNGPKLVSEQLCEAGRPTLILHRFMQGHEMCTERMTTRGTVIRRFYCRF